MTVVPLVVAAVLLPLFVLVERRAVAPMLDLTLFEDRAFSAATGAAFLSGLSRFVLTFVFVLYFQGAQGDDPILAGIKLAPLAAGISSPRRWPGATPTGTGRALSRRSACSS